MKPVPPPSIRCVPGWPPERSRPQRSSIPSPSRLPRPSAGPAAATTREKKINGRKRHIAVDTIGLLLTVLITAAGVQDRDGARPLLWNLRKAFPSIRLDLGRQRLRRQARHLGEDKAQAPVLTLQVIKRTEQHKFIVLPRRWVVERTFSWITRSRRTVRDYERLPGHHETMGSLGDDHYYPPPSNRAKPPLHPT